MSEGLYIDMMLHTPISKNIVSKNDGYQIGIVHYTTEKVYG